MKTVSKWPTPKSDSALDRLRRGSRRFHVQLDVEGYLRPGHDDLDGIIEEDGKPLTGAEVHAILVEAKGQGFVVLPVCDGHDERGRCRGHYVQPASIYC